MTDIWQIYVDRSVPKKKTWERILCLRRLRLFIRQGEHLALLQEAFTLFTNTFKVVICEIDMADGVENAIQVLNQEIMECINDGKLPITTVKLNGQILNTIDYMIDAVVMSMFD